MMLNLFKPPGKIGGFLFGRCLKKYYICKNDKSYGKIFNERSVKGEIR